MLRTLSLRLAAFLAAAWLAVTPSLAQAQKALVYCPVGVDAAGCNAIVGALAADASLFPGGVDAGYDGTSGTVDLATADLPGYAVLMIPSLADGLDLSPYALLRNATIAGRIRDAFVGRTAVWSGTPDVGSTNRAAKDALIRNLAAWARVDAAGTHGPGLVVLQDNSDDAAGRYGWMGALSTLAVAADTTLEVYSNVQALTATGRTILTNSSGLQIGYTNMASYGLVRGSGTGAADATGGRTVQAVLVTMAGESSDPNIATVTTDREDYAPGDAVMVTGAGWEPGETVDLLFHEEVDPPIHPDKSLTAVADADGHIVDQQYQIDDDDINVRFTLTATGLTSQRTAQTTFTDGNRTSFSTTAAGAEVTDFGAIAVNQCVPAFVQARQGGSLDNETGTVTLSSTPVGVAFFSNAACSTAASSVAFANVTSKTISFRFTATGTFTLKGDGTWSNSSNDASAAVTVKQNQVITFSSTAPSAAVVGGATYAAVATATSGQPVTFSSLTPGVCTSGGTNGATITPIAVGTCTVAADQAGNLTFFAAPRVTQTFTVGKASQTIAFSLAALPAKTFGDPTFSVASFASASSGLAVTFASQSLSRCTVTSTGTVTIVSAQSQCTLRASQPGNANFSAAPDVDQSFNIAKAGQTISFTSTAPVGAIVDGPTYSAAATATSGLTVTFSSLTTGVCTSSGTNGATITFVGGGTCTVAANQAGNGDYQAAPQLTQGFAVSAQAPQTIAFTSTAPAGAIFGGTYAVSATTSSGLAAAFSSLTPPVCTVLGSTVSFVGVGTCTVAANQPGNASFLAAPQVTQTFAVGQAGQTIAFAGLVDRSYGDDDFTVGATASSGLAVSFAASGDCTVLGATVHLTSNGSCTITAAQAGNANYSAAPDVPQVFSVGTAPVTPHITVQSREYDGTTVATITGRSLTGVVNSDDVSLDGGTASFADKDAGAGKTATGTGFTLVGEGAGKYQLSPATATATATISRRAITVTATTDSREYDGTTSSGVAPALTVGSLASGDVAAFTQSYDSKHVGTGKTLTPDGAVTDGNSGNNYTVTFAANHSGAMTARALAVSATGTTKTYDGNTTAAVTLSDDRVTGDALTLTYLGAAFDDRHAGTAKPVGVTGISVGGADAGNYTFNTTASASADIHRRPITVTAVTSSREYDGTTNSAGVPAVTTGTLVGGDTPSFTQAYATKHVGTGKTITPTGNVNDGNGGNDYDVTFADNTTGAITSRPITVAATADSKTYDRTTSSTATPTVTTGSLALGDVGEFTQTYADRNVGTGKTLTPAGSVNDGNSGGNYDVTYADSHAGIILAKPLAGTITADGREYDGSTGATIATRALSGVIAPDVVSYVGGTAVFDTRHVGTDKTVTATGLGLSGADAGNYSVNATATATATIAPRPIAVTAVADSRIYDGTTNSTGIPEITTGELATGDSKSFTQSFESKTVATGKTLTPAGVVSDGNGGADYAVSFADRHDGAITPRALTVTATGVPKVYDGSTSATVTLSDDRVAGDVLSLAYGSASFADKNAGAAKPVSVTGITVGGADAGNYTHNASAVATAAITRRPIAVTAAATNKYYDGNTAATVTLSATPLAGDVVTIAFATATFDNANVGTGKTVTVAGLTLGGADGGNYEPNPPTHTATATANILAWTLAGFYQPVDMPTGGMVLNSIKGGQTVPLKFEVFVGSVERTDVASVRSFVQAQVSCPSTPVLDEIEIVSTGGTVLRYDGGGGQFIQNWQTPKTVGACYRVTTTTQDNSSIIAYFRTK